MFTVFLLAISSLSSSDLICIVDGMGCFISGPITFVMSVRLSACISAASTVRIFVKFDIRIFYENLSRKSKGS